MSNLLGFSPVYIDRSGKQRTIPSNGLLNISGVTGNIFTIGGKPVMLADGSSSDGSSSLLSLQSAYVNSLVESGAAKINLSPNKDFSICNSLGTPFFSIDSETGKTSILNGLSVSPSSENIVSLSISPPNGVVPLVDIVNIKSRYQGVVDFAINKDGDTYIRSLDVDNLNLTSLNGVDISALTLHLSSVETPYKHYASEIKYIPGFTLPNSIFNLSETTVNAALDEIINAVTLNVNNLTDLINNISQGSNPQLEGRVSTLETEVQTINDTLSSLQSGNVKGINFQQLQARTVWTIHHNTNSRFIQFTVYDENERLIWPDDAFCLDDNTFIITFSNEQLGRAILSCILPPIQLVTE
jgi:hypothetical protein